MAVFDLDFTLIEADCELVWTDYLYDLGLVDRAYMRRIHRFDIDYLEGHLNYAEFDRALLSPLLPLEKAACDKLVANYLPLLQPHLRPWMLDVVEAHRRAGHRVVLATASNSYLVEPIAEILGITDIVCTRVEIKDGKPTGEIIGTAAFREGKGANLKQWAQGKDVDFEQSFAYSDSHNDIPLLSLVGHPMAVTPDRRMRAYARKNNWQIINKPKRNFFKWFFKNETSSS